ncbi:hypothetical protein FOWG_18110 [Fusarium oxysporum f. sp. lycopersici MN25]|nr:hypothetical protein FOWG_18110 [Fusarium oxysporum f. sp. lycopersici MN25]
MNPFLFHQDDDLAGEKLAAAPVAAGGLKVVDGEGGISLRPLSKVPPDEVQMRMAASSDNNQDGIS